MLEHLAIQLHMHWAQGKGKIFGLFSCLLDENTEKMGLECTQMIKQLYPKVELNVYTLLQTSSYPKFLGLVQSLKMKESMTIIIGEGLIENPEALGIVMECDTIILNVRAHLTERAHVEKAVNMLKRYQINLLGTVLNYGNNKPPSSVKI